MPTIAPPRVPPKQPKPPMGAAPDRSRLNRRAEYRHPLPYLRPEHPSIVAAGLVPTAPERQRASPRRESPPGQRFRSNRPRLPSRLDGPEREKLSGVLIHQRTPAPLL